MPSFSGVTGLARYHHSYLQLRSIHRWHTRATIDKVVYIVLSLEYEYTKPAKLLSAEVDPDQRIPLDLDWKNNSRTLKHREKENKRGGNYHIDVIRFMRILE